MGKTLQTYRKLFDTIKQGKIHKLYLLYGPEDYLKREFVREVIEAVLPATNRAFNLDIIYGDEFDQALFDDRLKSFPLFMERRIVILKNFSELSLPHKDYVIESAEQVADSMVFIIEAHNEKLDNARLRKLGKVADKIGLCAPFGLLDDQETMDRVMTRFKREGCTIDPDALDLLVESVGTRLIDLGNEVDKILLAIGEGETVDRKLVGDVVGKYRTESLFSLLDELSRKRPEQLLRTLAALVDGGEEPVFVLAMLLKRTVLLLLVCMLVREKGRAVSADKALADHMGGATSPFYAAVLRRQAARFSPVELEQLLTNLRWADIKLKTTQIDAKSVLQEALLASHLGKTLASPAP